MAVKGGERDPQGSRRSGRRPGRRTGDSDTRGAIAEAARKHFAEKGFAGATLRAIAADAGVDPALIVHFHGSKRELFLEVLQPPEAAVTRVRAALDGPLDTLPERFAAVLASVLTDPRLGQRMEAMLRTAASDPEAAAAIRAALGHAVLAPMAERLREGAGLNPDDAALRATMVGSAVAGVLFARRVVGIEPLATADPQRVAALLAGAVRSYLTPGPTGT
ncbi:TetR/AcrR family transcriptional regulator [Phycicoccus flavus]|uniref:TetR/AcrR family transcriptional regulator n=1 Tax=Phycicoccus flavus TaxID=2502783 RepID=UPI000FEBCDE8|nr:TetR family transcriptional regulator [Phycicoccus flavus]NHA68275.1 TetR family transcriptional regulator [Phycicoccus flavus]